MLPDLLSERIEEFRASFFRGKRCAITLEPDAIGLFDALLADFVDEARTLEARAAKADGLTARCATAIAATQVSIERAEQLRGEMVEAYKDSGFRAFDIPPGKPEPYRPLDRIVAELDEEAKATEAFAASIARTKGRIVEMRAAQDVATRRDDARMAAILDGVEAGKVSLFPIVPRPAFGQSAPTRADNPGRSAPTNGDVSVEAAIDFFAAITRDAPKSRFAADVSSGDRSSDRPTFDNSGDCA